MRLKPARRHVLRKAARSAVPRRAGLVRHDPARSRSQMTVEERLAVAKPDAAHRRFSTDTTCGPVTNTDPEDLNELLLRQARLQRAKAELTSRHEQLERQLPNAHDSFQNREITATLREIDNRLAALNEEITRRR